MKKHALIAFFASFCVSLVVINVAINGFSVPKKDVQNKKIVPSKNISLFLKSGAPKVKGAGVEGVGKINLNLDYKVPQEQNVEVELAVAQEEGVSPDFFEVSLDEGAEKGQEGVLVSDVVPIVYEKPIVKPNKIIENYAEFIEKPVVIEVEDVVEKESFDPLDGLVYSGDDGRAPDVFDVPLQRSGELVFDGRLESDDVSLSAKTANLERPEVGDVAEILEPELVDVVELKKETPWVEMKDVAVEKPQNEDGPWDVATGVKHPKNKMVLDLAPKEALVEKKKPIVKNVLIPISDETSGKITDVPDIVSGAEPVLRVVESAPVAEKEESEEIVSEKNLLGNITSLFSKASEDVGREIKKQISGVAEKIAPQKSVVVKKEARKEILPSEIRLVFAPNRVEISGQAVKWLGAFVEKTNVEDLLLEVRLGGSGDVALQKKRLKMVYDVLMAKGAQEEKIRTVFSQREPNSFVVRLAKEKKEEYVDSDYYKKYYQQW